MVRKNNKLIQGLYTLRERKIKLFTNILLTALGKNDVLKSRPGKIFAGYVIFYHFW